MITLLHGDCLDRMKEIKDGSVDLVLTDPPYGTTACKWDAVIPFAPMWEQVWRVLKPNGAAVFTASQPFTSALVMSQVKRFKYEWIWEKSKSTGFLNAKIQPLRAHESILVFSEGTPVYNPQMTTGSPYNKGVRKDQTEDDVYNPFDPVEVASLGRRYPRTVQRFVTAEREGGFHKSQKPVALIEYLIQTYTNEGETVLDFTMGSGTTGVACVRTNRKFIGIERDETYFNIAKDRIYSAIEEEKWKLI